MSLEDIRDRTYIDNPKPATCPKDGTALGINGAVTCSKCGQLYLLWRVGMEVKIRKAE